MPVPQTTRLLPEPSMRTINLATKVLAPSGIHATAEQRQAYLRYTNIGDPLADELVTMIRRLPSGSGRRKFEIAVEHGIDVVNDPPPELLAFFDAVDNIPYWTDFRRIDLACRVIGRTGVLVGFTSLSMAALMGGYLASRVAKTLVGTSDLTLMASRRLAETTDWFMAVTTPGGMDRFADGCKATLRVRLMHALVRAGMSRRPDWRHDAWDTPINQSQLAGTIMMFALTYLTGCQALGLTFTARERDAVFHLWRLVGHLLGVADEILPADETDHWKLMSLQADYEFGNPDGDSIQLAQALMQAIGPAVIGEGTSPLNRAKRWAVSETTFAYARLILGRTDSDFLGLPDRKPVQALVIALAAAIRILEYPRRLIPGATRWSEAHGRRSQRAVSQRMTARYGSAGYGRHDHLASGGRSASTANGSHNHPTPI